MNSKSTIHFKKFRNFSNNSGCILANYNILNDEKEISYVEDVENEFSGQFNIYKSEKK